MDQSKFCHKYALPYDLIADPSGKVCDAFGVKYPNNLANRETFVYRHGRLIWHDPNARAKFHAQDISNAIIRQQRRENAADDALIPVLPQSDL